MSHSSDPDQPARRRTGVVVILAVLMVLVGGVLATTPSTGAASAWADPPLELAVTVPDGADHSVVRRWTSAPSAVRTAGSAAPAPVSARFPRASARQTMTTTVGDAPPPGRSPPRH